MASGTIEKLVAEIYKDSKVSPGEIMKLRDEVERAEQQVLQSEGVHGVTSALCKSFDVTDQLLQENLLLLRKGQYSEMGRAMVLSMLDANLTLLKATIDAFTD
jgi:hypothetical protein